MFRLLFLFIFMLRTVSLRSGALGRRMNVRFAANTKQVGTPGQEDFRIQFVEDKKIISPWHDISLRSGEYFNFVNEIPKFTKAKFEIATKEKLNPISQDKNNGKLRDYCGPIFWNYGAFPQTWEDPNIIHPVCQCKGDNDPLDVVEIGSKALETGTVHEVKVLGILAMIDDGELDWKVIAIHSQDELAPKLNDICDVEQYCPGVVSGIREWFRWYKTPDSKPLNRFGYDEQALPRKHALEVIEETHLHWKHLREGKVKAGNLWFQE